MSFIFGANGSYIRDRRLKKQRTPSRVKETEKVNPKSIIGKFNQIKCKIHPEHGSYDFICIAPKCPYDRLICIDCFKDQPDQMKYMQNYGKYFLRMNKFIDAVSQPQIGPSQYKKLEEVNKLQAKLLRMTQNHDKNVASEVKNLKEFYRNVEDGIIDAVRAAMRNNYEATLATFEENAENMKDKLNATIENCKNLTSFGNSGHLKSLDRVVQLVRSGENEDLLIKKINEIAGILVNMDKILSEWTKRISSFGVNPEKFLRPSIDFSELRNFYKQKEVIITEELENLERVNLRDPYSYYTPENPQELAQDIKKTLMNKGSKDKTNGKSDTIKIAVGDNSHFLQDLAGHSFEKEEKNNSPSPLDFTKNLDISKINVKN